MQERAGFQGVARCLLESEDCGAVRRREEFERLNGAAVRGGGGEVLTACSTERTVPRVETEHGGGVDGRRNA